MVVGRITISTCYGNADIPVEVLGKGPRPGTAWVKALDDLHPFTKFSHGGPFQDDTAAIPIYSLRDVHLEPKQVQKIPEEPAIEAAVWIPDRIILEEDWFLEATYEDRTCTE